MSDEQPKEQIPKRRAGSISRYTTLGSSKAPERANVDTSRSPDPQTSEHTDAQTSERANTQTSKDLNAQTLEHSDVETFTGTNVQESEHPNVQALARQSTQEEKRPGGRTSGKRERHTIYFPPELSEWVKINAVRTKREISEVVTEAVERYRQQEEGK